jgi:serine---pyruvate transaminase
MIMNKYRLMIPGPTPTPPQVAVAGALPLVDERIPQFAALFDRVLGNLRRVFGTAHDVLVFASSTTGSMEGAIANLFSPGDRVVVVDNGFFAARWVAIARAYQLDVVELAQPWGTVVDNVEVARTLDADPTIRAAICVHCETSTGAVSDLAGFGAATAGVLSIADAASSLGALPVRADDWGLDVVVSGCHKALMTPPGLSFVSVSERAWRAQAVATLPRFYFDWRAAKVAMDHGGTPWTPAVGLIVQLDAALVHLFDEGLDAVAERHVRLGRSVRAAVKALGLTPLAADDDANAVVTAAVCPPYLDAAKLTAALLDGHGVQMSAGYAELANRLIRIGHCGYVDRYDVVVAVAALEQALHDEGHPVEMGAAVAAAQAAYGPASRAVRT